MAMEVGPARSVTFSVPVSVVRELAPGGSLVALCPVLDKCELCRIGALALRSAGLTVHPRGGEPGGGMGPGTLQV